MRLAAVHTGDRARLKIYHLSKARASTMPHFKQGFRAMFVTRPSRIFGLVCLTLLAGTVSAHAQTYTVLHNFTGRTDGGLPLGTLAIDFAGNLYGTASAGGNTTGLGCNTLNGCGTVFKLARRNGAWIYSLLYTFQGQDDGASPYAGVTIGPNGSLYGTTNDQGTQHGGTLYNLQPPINICASVSCPWTETILHRFTGNEGTGDAANPGWASVTFDPAGNIYGPSAGGGTSGFGAVYKLTKSGSSWNESVLYSFNAEDAGSEPLAALALDASGNLYGNTFGGNPASGCVYQLTPSGSNYIENTIFCFARSGTGFPDAGMVFDHAGNLYGTGTIPGALFELSPSGDSWTFQIPAPFPAGTSPNYGPVVFDGAGNLYGTTVNGGANGAGSIYKLTSSQSGWTMTTLYSFTGGSDGGTPVGGVVLDSSGSIYGTASVGGSGGQGVVFELVP